MRFLWMGVRKDGAMLRREPFGLAISIGIPLILAVLMNMVFGPHGNATLRARLLVADEDASIASNLLLEIFRREPLNRMVTMERVKRKEGRAVMDRGEASALLVIPAGLQRSFLRGEPYQLQLITNPKERINPAIIQEALGTALDGASYVQKISGPELRALDGAPGPRMGLAAARVFSDVQRSFVPAPIEVELKIVKVRKSFDNFAALFFPCMIFMSLMMVTNSLAGEIWRERMLGTLRRLAATPVPLGWYLAGRVLFAAFVMLCVGITGVVAVHALAGVPVANFPLAVMWIVFSGSALYLLLLYLVMHASTPRTANILGNMLIFPFAFVGGCFFPFEAMPDWMASIGRMTPNGWAITQFKAILDGSAQTGSVALSSFGLLAVSTLMFALAARRMRREFLL